MKWRNNFNLQENSFWFGAVILLAITIIVLTFFLSNEFKGRVKKIESLVSLNSQRLVNIDNFLGQIWEQMKKDSQAKLMKALSIDSK